MLPIRRRGSPAVSAGQCSGWGERGQRGDSPAAATGLLLASSLSEEGGGDGGNDDESEVEEKEW